MSAIDPESFHSPSQINPIPLLEDSSPELKHYSLNDTQIESTSGAFPKEADNVVVLTDLCRFKFMRNALFLTSFYLFAVVLLAYLLSLAEPSQFSMFLDTLDHILGTEHFFTISFVICVILSRLHAVARVNIVNFVLFGIYTVAIVNYIALKGVWAPFASVSLDTTVCLCLPIQVACLAGYITSRRKIEIAYAELAIPSLISLIISAIIILLGHHLNCLSNFSSSCFACISSYGTSMM